MGGGLDPFEITGRARDRYGADGRPGLPPQAGWPIFPFEKDGLRGRPLDDPVLPEPPRHGESAADCRTCAEPDDAFVWTDARWRVSMSADPVSLPCLTIHTREHLDFSDLTDALGAELGVLLVRAERALGSLDGVGRVHVYKWGDGGAHLHVFLVARPAGMMQLRGMFLSTWMHVLPPLPDEQWRGLRRSVAERLGPDAAG